MINTIIELSTSRTSLLAIAAYLLGITIFVMFAKYSYFKKLSLNGGLRLPGIHMGRKQTSEFIDRAYFLRDIYQKESRVVDLDTISKNRKLVA